MGIIQSKERYMVRGMCRVQLKDKKRVKHLMPMFGFSGTIYQLVKAISVHWHGKVVVVEDGQCS